MSPPDGDTAPDSYVLGVQRPSAHPSPVARSIAQFAIAGLGAVVIIGIVAVLILRNSTSHEAIRDARELAGVAGRGVAQPLMTPELLRGDPAALRRVDRAIHASVLGHDVVRVKIWDARGRIVYSDEPRLIGHTYTLGEDETNALRHGGVFSDASDLSRPENRFERSYHRLLEVYLPIRATDGTRLLYEDYERQSQIAASSHRQWSALLPGLIGALVVLWLVQVPLAWSLARRLRERQREREQLLRRAIESSDMERRRIAAHLHDGAVQRLAGVSFALAAEAGREATAGSPERAATLRRASGAARETVRELRTLLVDIYPPTLQRSGLAAAVADLAALLSETGIDVTVDVPEPLDVPDGVEALFFRVTQEALRNAGLHSRARHVEVAVDVDGRRALLRVTDDGRGFDREALRDNGHGHFGLRLMEDLARDAGGVLDVRTAPDAGTTISLEVPLR